MEDLLTRIWENAGGRLDGPLWLRLLIQPTVAAVLAVRAGLADSRGGRPPYFWALLTNASARQALLHDGWRDIAKVFVMAAVMDVTYQLIAFGRVYPVSTLIVASLLAGVPYLLIRGPVNRLKTGNDG
jgi:hypothetical protein